MTYRVQEFADLAGVSVRTLHHYDEIGLLKPARKGNHRHYTRRDLLQLQQILTLKYLGFTLDEVRDMLADPAYDAAKALRAQQAVVEAQIARLGKVAAALEQSVAVVTDAEAADWHVVCDVIRGVLADDRDEWYRQYYTPGQLADIRSRQPSEGELLQIQQQWRDLIAAFEAEQHHEPSHPAVQALAAQAYDLVTAFTGGDREIEASVRRMYENDNIPPEHRMFGPQLGAFIGKAIDHYKEHTHADTRVTDE